MKELSLNILDIAENSVKAGATLTEITVTENSETLVITVRDDGHGMSEDTLMSVTNPFYTTRTTRNVGLGIPLLKMAAEQTGGKIELSSAVKSELNDNHGTTIKAYFNKKHIDYTPLGDIISSITTLIHGHPDTDFRFIHSRCGKEITLDTRELRAVLEDVPLNSYEVIKWIEGYLQEQYNEIQINN